MQRRRDRFLTAIACASCVALAAAARADVTVSTAVDGPVYGDGGAFTVTTSGTITGSSDGVVINSDRSATMLDVQGRVAVSVYAVSLDSAVPTATISGIVSGERGVHLDFGASLGTLTNSGTVEASDYGMVLNSTGTLTNTSAGVIRTTSGNMAIYQYSDIGLLDNAGRIEGFTVGMFQAGGTLTALTNSGTISGNTAAMYMGSTIGTLTNQAGGVISGTTASAITIEADSGVITNQAGALIQSAQASGLVVNGTYTRQAVNNAGRIDGGSAGVTINGSLPKVTNSGTIAYTGSGTGPAVFIGTGHVLGDATGASGEALTSVGAGALLAGTIENRGTVHHGFTIGNQNVTVSAGGGAGTFTNGTLQVPDGDLTFTNGQTTLGADISVNGGTGTVFNDATLRLTTIKTVSGNYQQAGGGTVLLGLSGTGSGQYGRLDVSGGATLAGTLAIADMGISGGLSDGQTFQVLEFGSYTGGFSTLSFNGGSMTNLGGGVWGYGSVRFTEQWTPTTMSVGVSFSVTDVTVSTAVTGPVPGAGGTFTVTPTGSITGSGVGIDATAGLRITTLTVDGVVDVATVGVHSDDGTLSQVVNSGTIQGGTSGMLHAGTTGTLSNLAGGLIKGGTESGILVTGTVTSVSNAGTIASDSTDYPHAAIGLSGAGRIGTLTNTGMIIGQNQSAIRGQDDSVIDLLVNSGTISTSGYYTALDGDLGSLINQVGGLITSGSGNAIQGNAGSIDNYGTIAGRGYAIEARPATPTATITNRAGGVISGTANTAIAVSGSWSAIINEAGGLIESNRYEGILWRGRVGTINNAGIIRSDEQWALKYDHEVTTFINSGTISGGDDVNEGGVYMSHSTGGITTNTATGVITGVGTGYRLNKGSVMNAGQFRGSDVGARLDAYASSLTNQSGGVISGTATAGVVVRPYDETYVAAKTVTNQVGGLIESAQGDGVWLEGFTSSYVTGTLANAGVINGGASGVRVQESILRKLTNTGTIGYTGAGAGPAVYVMTDATLGDATGAGGPALTSTGSGALIAGTIENRGTIHYGFTIDNQNVTVSAGGGAGTFTSGTLQVTDGNLTFTGGTLTLGADVSVDGGSGTFTNEATLRMLGIENVTGNFQQTSGGTVLMELLGTGSGQYGQMNVSGAVSFAGGLALGDTGLTGGLADGQSFQLFGFGSYTGGFSGLSVNGTSLSSLGGGEWLYGTLKLTEQWTSTTMSLGVSSSGVPEIDPAGMASVLSLVVGSLGLAERRLRRGRRAGDRAAG